MVKGIFVNLPVQDVKKSKEFFSGLGFTFNEQFSDESSLSMMIGENMYAMLLQHERFKTFIKKDISDSAKTTEVLLALQLESREEVREMMEKVLALGGRIARDYTDHGFMLDVAFEDLDHHIWEIFYMEPSHIQG